MVNYFTTFHYIDVFRRSGEAKSVFGRKTCQKTAGKQGHRSRSPPMMKYESCEEEVIEDDYALYEDMDVHSTVPASKAVSLLLLLLINFIFIILFNISKFKLLFLVCYR